MDMTSQPGSGTVPDEASGSASPQQVPVPPVGTPTPPVTPGAYAPLRRAAL